MRKLGIPSPRDKILQEVMRMIMEAIYDSPHGSSFEETSHGFEGTEAHTRRCKQYSVNGLELTSTLRETLKLALMI